MKDASDKIKDHMNKPWRITPLVFIFFVATAIFMLIDWMGATFGRVSIDQIRFVYHSSLTGMNMAVVHSLLWRLGALAVFCLLFATMLWLLRRRALAGKLLLGGVCLYLVAAFVDVGRTLDLLSLFSKQESPFIGEHYVSTSTMGITFPEKKRNLVIVLAESAEHTFNDRTLFAQPVMPELEALAAKHISFRGHQQVPGTQWTIAGMTSFLFGIPLRLPLFDWNDYSLFDTFLPGAESLLEVFEAEGYEVAMILGSDMAFSGKKNLFDVHAPQAVIRDLNYFLATRDDVDENRGTEWGLNDAYVFERAKEYLSLKDDGKPFVLIVETVDTHAPDPYVAPGAPRPFGDERDAFAALSRNVADFVGWLDARDLGTETTIVVLGDHQVMAERLGAVDLSDARREVYNLIINGAVAVPEAGIQRSFASFDLCPTILESVGAIIPNGRFGIGSSLYSAAPTLLESNGAEEVTAELELYSPFYMRFYQAPGPIL